MRRIIALIVVSTSSMIGLALNSDDRPIVHGTINLVLANGNGAVVLTDSMLSAGSKQLPQPGKKLFKIDDKTVCTLAGFVSGGVSTLGNAENDLLTNSGAVITDFAQQYQQYRLDLPMEQRLELLSVFLRVHLSMISSARSYSELTAKTPLGSYEVQVIMAGYDRDGLLKIGRIVLKTAPEKNYIDAKPISTRWQIVNESLAWELSGVDRIARPSLENPKGESGRLGEFAISMKANGGKTLTINQLRKIAVTLARRTAARYKGVGGKHQIAILKGGKIAAYEQDPFPTIPSPTHFSLMVGSTIPRNGFVTNETMVYITNVFRPQERSLDDNYYFNNYFDGCILTYNGGRFVFDKSNKIQNTTLRLGPKADRNKPAVKQLIREFSWARIE